VLVGAGLETITVYVRTSAHPAGTVIAMTPKQYTLVKPGTIVTITVARSASPPLVCPSQPLLGVYHSYRLIVLGACRWYQGTVTSITHEADGDYHVDVAPGAGYKGFLDSGNFMQQHGSLVTEIMPGQALPVPSIGERVAVFGTWVHDEDHGWNEIHPIWAVETLDTGTVVYRLPPATAGYGSGSGASGTGSGGTGGGSCSGSQGYYTSSYPTAYLIYPTSNPDWHDLSPTYLRHFCTLAQARAAFPGRSVDTDG